MKDKRDYIITLVKKKIFKIDPKARIILFGSRARNDYRNSSDWDFLILTSSKVSPMLKNEILDELFETELETDEMLTAIIQNQNEWQQYSKTPIFKNIQKDGIEV
ncbi:MAG TPA: nucleotidyltransferase domain-containing protein [Draconibacterium sp.]|nr:nucleotidyltransferase domain-containing protein [Draconibacterium sp.]